MILIMKKLSNTSFNITILLCVMLAFLSHSASVSAAEFKDGVTHLTQDEFMSKSKEPNVVVIDVRTIREYRSGHIENAINHPHKNILKNVTLLDQYVGKELIFYCHSGIRVKIITDYVRETKYVKNAKLFHLKGDMRAWRARRLPLVKPA